MNNKKLCLLIGSIFLLASCGNGGWQGCGNSCEDITSTFTVDDETTYESHEWDANVVSMLKYTVGDVASSIPSYTATDYAVSIGSQTSDDGSLTIKFTDVKCYPVSASADVDYAQKLKIYGFTDVAASSYAFAKASATKDLIVQYEVVEGKEFTYLSILCYTVEYRSTEWPTELVEAVLSYDLPHIEGEAYEGSFDSYYMAGYVYVYGVSSDADQKYASTLTSNGWVTASGGSSAYSYNLTSPDGWITVSTYMTYDSYEAEMLLIKFENAWPYLELCSVMDGDLPKHTNDSLSFEYKWISTEANGDVLTLYYDGATEVDYVTYCSLLEKDGWTLATSDGTSQGVTSSGTHYSYYSKGTHEVDVLYAESYGTIAIPVYC